MIRWLRQFLFLCRVSWAMVSGRWFFLRNEPYWLVKTLADSKPDDSHEECIHDVHEYARLEIIARDERGDQQDYGTNNGEIK